MGEESQQSQKNKFRRFGFAGLCFVVGLICFFIQKGDAALNLSLTWIGGMISYSAAAILIIAGIWFWDQTANRHWILRTILSVSAIAAMALITYSPVAQQYRREHPIQVTAPPKPPSVLPAAGPPLTNLAEKKEAKARRTPSNQINPNEVSVPRVEAPGAQGTSPASAPALPGILNNCPNGIWALSENSTGLTRALA